MVTQSNAGTEPTLPGMPEPVTLAPHVLVVEVDSTGTPWFKIECPGVTDACRSWIECQDKACTVWRDHTDRCRDDCSIHFDPDNDEPTLHGIRHLYSDSVSGWCTPQDQCWPATNGDLRDVAMDLRETWASGRYPVRHGLDADYDYSLTLTLIEEN